MATLTIKYGGEDFFVKYLEILSPLLKLTRKERLILSEIMKEDYLRRDLNLKDRYRIILSYEGRVDICNSLDINPQSFRNALGVFRREGYLTRDKNNIESLAPYLRVDPDKFSQITFNFVKETKDG